MNQSFLKDAPLVEIEDFKKWILHEDENLLVIDKPGWLVCHPSKNGPFSSLVGTAKEYLKTQTLHLVSRLDRETSGVVMLAKNRKAASYWQKGVERKTVRRYYLAILEGVVDEPQKVATFLGKDPLSAVYVKQRVTENSRKAKYAETDFIPLQSQGGYTFCSIATLTGRKHQIRVHAQSIGFPLVGEKLYGKDESIYLDFCTGGWREEWHEMLGMYRQALHGRCLADLNSDDEFLSPLAEDFEEFLRVKMTLKSNAIHKLVRAADIQFRQNLPKN
tara:strand:- start:131 stop:955 length:825 start_codon:yes stop_codon:yes gene_type:complete